MTKDIEREAFEQLPDIKGILQDGYGFNSELNQYFHPDIENHRLGCAFIMGAWMAYQARAKKLEGCVVVPATLSMDLAKKRAEYIYQSAKKYLDREYRNLSANQMQLFKERWIESKAVRLQTDYLLTLESARGGNEN